MQNTCDYRILQEKYILIYLIIFILQMEIDSKYHQTHYSMTSLYPKQTTIMHLMVKHLLW